MNVFSQSISNAKAKYLERQFEEEIQRAIWAISIKGAPGPDEFTEALCQSCLDIIKDDVLKDF